MKQWMIRSRVSQPPSKTRANNSKLVLESQPFQTRRSYSPSELAIIRSGLLLQFIGDIVPTFYSVREKGLNMVDAS